MSRPAEEALPKGFHLGSTGEEVTAKVTRMCLDAGSEAITKTTGKRKKSWGCRKVFGAEKCEFHLSADEAPSDRGPD